MTSKSVVIMVRLTGAILAVLPLIMWYFLIEYILSFGSSFTLGPQFLVAIAWAAGDVAFSVIMWVLAYALLT